MRESGYQNLSERRWICSAVEPGALGLGTPSKKTRTPPTTFTPLPASQQLWEKYPPLPLLLTGGFFTCELCDLNTIVVFAVAVLIANTTTVTPEKAAESSSRAPSGTSMVYGGSAAFVRYRNSSSGTRSSMKVAEETS